MQPQHTHTADANANGHLKTENTDVVPANEDYVDDTPVSLAGPDLFNDITIGLHEGFMIEDLGWAIFSIREKLGIEALVAIAKDGSTDPQRYFDWVQSKVGVALTDWEPVRLTLYQIWIETTVDGLPYCFRQWSYRGKDPDALSIRPTDVFALRHRAWPLLKEDRVREFYVALQRSSMQARWERAKPGRDMRPQDMEGDAGYVVAGKPRGGTRQINLTWPVADISTAIQQAVEFQKNRMAQLSIYELKGVGLPFNKKTQSGWMRIAAMDKQWEGNGCLLDHARRAGMCTW